MKIETAIAMTLALAASAHAANKVRVCVSPRAYAPLLVLSRAEGITSQMFATAGVAIEWRVADHAVCQNPGPTRRVILDFAADTPQSEHPGALAYAKPYEAIHIVVLYDRIAASAKTPGQRSALLAHVMTHEITHLLQEISRHSQTGVMKAHWDGRDLQQMTCKPLPFEPMDIDLIERGLTLRAASVTPTELSATQVELR